LQNLVERNGVAGADVEGASRGAGSFASESVGKHGVINIGEVTGLLAVAEDDRWSGVEKRSGKAREHSGVGRIGIWRGPKMLK